MSFGKTFGHYRACTDYRVRSQYHARQNHAVHPDPAALADADGLRLGMLVQVVEVVVGGYYSDVWAM